MRASIYAVAAILAGYGLLAEAQAEGASSAAQWQLQLLMEPSAQQIRVEDKGRIVIYDGLKSSDIDRALDKHFDRIQNMMFIRTQIPTSIGGYRQDDDGC